MKRALSFVFLMMVGCGGARGAAMPAGSTATTGASTDPPTDSPNAPAAAPSAEAREAPAPDEASDPPPAGRLVCRTTDSVDGTSELWLDWQGDEATGVIRTVGQSGMHHEQRVTAERADSLIVVDDPHEVDLVTHAAILQQKGGALIMRLGGGSSGNWNTCKQ